MKLFSDLLKAHIPVYLSKLASLFSLSFSEIKWNWMSRMGLLNPPKAQVSVLHYDHIRWTQLYCVCKVTSTISSSPCSSPFIYSSLLSFRWNFLWKKKRLEFIRWSKLCVNSHMYGYVHVYMSFSALFIYCKKKRHLYYYFHTLFPSYSHSKHQRLRKCL